MAEFTKEQIEKLKKKHGRVFLFTSGDKSCLLKLAGRNELSYATTCATTINGDKPQFDANKFNEAVLQACWLDGDEEIKIKDEYFLGISDQLQELIKKSTFQVKEL